MRGYWFIIDDIEQVLCSKKRSRSFSLDREQEHRLN